MARRKAEQWASEAERIEAMPDRRVEPAEQTGISEPAAWPPPDNRTTEQMVAEAMAEDAAITARREAFAARLSAIPAMTDRAAINALAEAVADLARLMR